MQELPQLQANLH
ncbi:hypothetical protein Patl1_34928 [Pistacia atlantica]|uniref:Uncharacterized protein n=1 Tax=Pistacia atlantica TaxID=434234 RepID=A0ACC0ZPG3_9ROSI|nr:hypothetical protein Patl1_34928 [Pistacia atlantica]